MDLNKAMVEMYKKRRQLNTTPKNNSKTINSPIVQDDAQAVKKPKLEDVIRSMDYNRKASFDDIHGCENERDEILDIIASFQRYLDGLTRKDEWPVLICGSKGLGKTSIVESAANHAKLNLIPIRLGTLHSQTRNRFNRFEERMELLMEHCLASQPAIVLIDDLDQVSDKEDYCLLLKSAIMRLSEEGNKLLIICTTSPVVDCIKGIDFPFTLYLKRPNMDARHKILLSLRENDKALANLSDEDLKTLALETPSFTALDLRKMFYIAKTKSKGLPTIGHCDTAVQRVKQSFERGTHLIEERPSITWTDIGGLTEVRNAFVHILGQIRQGDISCKFAGVLLYGPPGCGKTMVAQAMANEAGFNFISIKPSELVDKFLGETEKNIRRVFREAKEHEPCMIYFDEFDGLCGRRGHRDTVAGAIQTLLSEMDGFKNRGRSIILAATNRVEDIDPAMKRPGRLTEHIYVGPPNEKARRDILGVITNRPGLALATDVDLDVWAKRTENFTGADLDFLIAKAKNAELERMYRNSETSFDRVVLSNNNIEFAMNQIRETNKDLGKKTKYN